MVEKIRTYKLTWTDIKVRVPASDQKEIRHLKVCHPGSGEREGERGGRSPGLGPGHQHFC